MGAKSALETTGDARTRGAEAVRALRAHALLAPMDIDGPLTAARLAMRQAEGRIAHDYSRASAQARAAGDDLAHFKRRHRLDRAAVYPASRVLQAGILLCAAVLEASFSAALFAETDDRGLLGGAVTAVGLSGANVTLGFLAGFLGLRYLQHRNSVLKTAGAIAFGALAGLALFLNFFAAIWRQATAGAGVSDGGFLSSAFSLTEPQAIVLLMLGGGVWVFAALKGYSGFDDPYPDFGKLARASESAAEDLADVRAEVRDALEEPIGDAREALELQLEQRRAALAQMTKLYDDAAQEIARLPAADEDPLAGAGSLISQARDALVAAQERAHQGLAALQDALDEAQARLDATPAP